MTQELVACVVGLSNNSKEPFGTRPGVGKSCLCFRFSYPGHDNYIKCHPSLLALHEFENPVVNHNHFIYWGSPLKAFPVKGGEVRVRFHVIEQTVFYQDITSLPFNIITCPDNLDHYCRRIGGPIESPGKHSYYSRDDIVSTENYVKLQYPQNMTRVARGYVVAFDVSLMGEDFDMQCKRAEHVLNYLSKQKKKFVIAATKRDACKSQTPGLEKVYELQKKYHTIVVETSAHDDLNVNEVFRILAHRLLSKKIQGLSDKVQHYNEAAQQKLLQRGSAKRSFLSFVKKRIQDCDERLPSVQSTEEYKECAMWIGAQQTGRIFAQNAIELYNVKIDRYAGIQENVEMRQEFLEDFVDQRSDLTPYKMDLRL